jgi:proteasome accessory factor PafA2
VSIPKVVGIEQEYAIKIKGDENVSIFDASCMLVNAYARRLGLRNPEVNILWDYGHETPYQDIRGDLFGKNTGQQIVNEEENRLINAALPNGARLYTDHAHPEYSTPECLSARDALACDKAGEIVFREGLKLMKAMLPSTSLTLYKNNIDHQGHSYGCHENYLMAADAHEACLVSDPQRAVKSLIPFLVTRQIFAGSGMVGDEKRKNSGPPYRISQRADFMEKLFGLETMYSRPIINTRREHHADPKRFRRLHLILGDANMCEFAGFLKMGATQIILQMLENDFIPYDLALADPVKAIRQISGNFNCVVELADGRKLTAVQIQREFLKYAQKFRPPVASGRVADDDLILDYWSYALDGLEQLELSGDLTIEDDPLQLARRLDWVLKLWIINRYREGQKCTWGHPLLRVLDLQYHNIDAKEGIFYRTQDQDFTERILSDDEIARFVHAAPDNTRAWFRGQCLERFAEEINLLNWEVVGFDQGDVYRMVPLLNPLKGTRDQFQKIFKQSQNARELIALLESGSAEP